MKTKICTRCKKRKSVDDFTVRRNTSNTNTIYRKAACKKCSVILTTKWYQKNKDRVLAYQKKYHEQKRN